MPYRALTCLLKAPRWVVILTITGAYLAEMVLYYILVYYARFYGCIFECFQLCGMQVEVQLLRDKLLPIPATCTCLPLAQEI